ncbi:MAG: nitrophenyl compound nitroreductase subunit ArsF family protein [Candidatus Moraniibacteriota bacterium]
MKKNLTLFLYGGLLFLVAFFVWTIYNDNRSEIKLDTKNNSKNAKVEESQQAEKIQVFLFYATQRCSSCIAIGKYAKETVEQNFSEELKSGKIEFREINIDLPENKELAGKFEATGSALFINAIINSQDNIKQNIQVWKLTTNEQKFISYLSGELKKLL